MLKNSELPPATEDLLTFTLEKLKEIESDLMLRGADNLMPLMIVSELVGRIGMHLRIYGTAKENK